MTPRSRHFWAVVAAVATCAVGAAHGVGDAQNFGSSVTEQYFRIDAESGVTKNGRPVVRGYVHNRSPYDLGNIRLRIDASTEPRRLEPITLGWVNGDLERNGRRYFEIAVPRADATYLVSVESFEVLFNDLGK